MAAVEKTGALGPRAFDEPVVAGVGVRKGVDGGCDASGLKISFEMSMPNVRGAAGCDPGMLRRAGSI